WRALQGRVVPARSCLDHDFVTGNRKGGLAGKLFFNGINNMVRAERFAVIFADVTMRGKAGFGAQIASKLAGVIVFDNNDPPTGGKHTADMFAVERHYPLN